MNQAMITIVEVKKNRKKYLVSTLNNDYSFEEDTIIKYGIFKNKEFTKDELENIIRDDQKNKILNIALFYLSFRNRTVFEVYTYLRKKDYSEQLVLSIIDRLKDLEYLNDRSFSLELIDYYIRINKGPKVIIEKLKQKGIDELIINETMVLYDDETVKNVIQTIIEKNIKNNIQIGRASCRERV